MPKISIIVPVYNAEIYLHRCVDSILAQTFTDFELLLIDDGSPDKSGEICDEYAKKDSRIRVFHKENGGVSSARQCGLDNAQGEYVIHADPDDWVEPNMLEELYNKAKEENADIVVCDFIVENLGQSIIKNQNCPNDSIECIKLLLLARLHGSTWNKLVRRNVFVNNNIRFPEHIDMWEDICTMIPVFYYSSKIAYVPLSLYHYVKYNDNSYTTVRSLSSLKNMIDAISYIEAFLKDKKITELSHELNYTKIEVKVSLLRNSNGTIQKEWSKLYPEANSYIFKSYFTSLYHRIAIWFASNGMLIVYNAMMKFRKLIRG